MRRARWKRKSVCSKLAHRCKFGGNGFCENCCAGEELRTKSRAGCRACPALYAVLIVASNLRVQRGHPLPPFPLPLPLSFQGGAGGNRNPPAFLFRGPGGHSLFKREYPLGFSVPSRYVPPGIPLVGTGNSHRLAVQRPGVAVRYLYVNKAADQTLGTLQSTSTRTVLPT